MKARIMAKDLHIYKALIKRGMVAIQLERMGKPILIHSSEDLDKFYQKRSSTPKFDSSTVHSASSSFHSISNNTLVDPESTHK